MLLVAVIVAVASFILLAWVFLLYPLCLALWPTRARSYQSGDLPGVSVVVPTYNEAAVIAKKIDNLIQLDYPADKLEILVVDSASTDGTADVAAKSSSRVRVIREEAKLGKAHAINTALPLVMFDLVLITDANAFMDPLAIRRMVEPMTDPAVGAATGAMRQIDHSQNAISEGGGLYWKMEVFMRQRESRLHSVVAMSGEMSLFRKSLFLGSGGQVQPWYQRGRTDDMEMSLWVIRHGFQVAYVPTAHIWEYAPDNLHDFFSQKVRIIVQTIRSVFGNLDIIFSSGWYGLFIFPSRKLWPLFAPLALVLAFMAAGLLALTSTWWLVIFLSQVIGYLLAALALKPLQKVAVARLALFFVTLNATVAAAWWQLLRGKDFTSWQPIASSRRLPS